MANIVSSNSAIIWERFDKSGITLLLAQSVPKIFRKNYMSAKVGWAVGFIDWLDAFIRHSSIE